MYCFPGGGGCSVSVRIHVIRLPRPLGALLRVLLGVVGGRKQAD